MAEEELIQDNLLWDDVESWSFPTLDRGDELDADKKEEEAPPPKGKKRSAAATRGGDGGESDDHELHIWTERERRKKMRNMFANLHALLPHIPPKADKSTIVDEAVKFIKKLQQSHEELQRRKLERAGGLMLTREAFIAEQGSSSPNSGPEYPAIFKTWTSPNVILNVCGRDGHLSVCTIKKPGLLSAICFVMEKHSLDLVSAHLSSHRHTCIYMIHTRANLGSNQFLQAFPVEEIFKQAAAEIMLWVMQTTIAKQLSVDEGSVTPQTKFTDLGADSLDTEEIMMALEEKFGVSIGDGRAENIATVQDATDLIEKVKEAVA